MRFDTRYVFFTGCFVVLGILVKAPFWFYLLCLGTAVGFEVSRGSKK